MSVPGSNSIPLLFGFKLIDSINNASAPARKSEGFRHTWDRAESLFGVYLSFAEVTDPVTDPFCLQAIAHLGRLNKACPPSTRKWASQSSRGSA